MIYPAFTQQKECGPYTIKVSMNLDSWELFQFASERYCFERERIVNDIADAEKCAKAFKDWFTLACKLWDEITMQ